MEKNIYLEILKKEPFWGSICELQNDSTYNQSKFLCWGSSKEKIAAINKVGRYYFSVFDEESLAKWIFDPIETVEEISQWLKDHCEVSYEDVCLTEIEGED